MSYGKLWQRYRVPSTTSYDNRLVDGTYNWKKFTSTWDSVEPGRSFALKNGNTLWSWKDTGFTQSGLGWTATGITTPAQIGANTWLDISDSSRNGGSKSADFPTSTAFFPTNTTTGTEQYPSFLGIRSTGTLWYFFNNGSGWTQQQIGSDTDWVQVSYGPPNGSTEGCNFAAIKSNGKLYTWGDNTYSQLGFVSYYVQFGTSDVNATTDDITYNNHGYTDGTYVVYTNGGGTTIGGLSNGTTYKIFNATTNTFQLKTLGGATINFTGSGSGTNHRITQQGYATPQQVGTDTNWASAKVSSFNGWALKTTGAVYAWGNGTTTGYYTTSGSDLTAPTLLAGALAGKTVTKIVAHYAGASAIATDNNAYSWGTATAYGQSGSNTDRKPVVCVNAGQTVTDIASAGTKILVAQRQTSYSYVSADSIGNNISDNWVAITGSDVSRPGSDWLTGNSLRNSELYIENWSRPNLSSTLNVDNAPDIFTTGLGSVSYNSNNITSVDINWGDGSTADTYAVVAGTNYTKTHNFFTYLDTDDIVNIALTASNPRFTSGDAVTTTYSNIKVYQVLPNPVISYAGDTTVTVPSGTTTTGSLTFNNAAMARHPGLTAEFPSNYWLWTWGDGTTSTINVQTGLAGNENTNISRTLNLGLTAGVGAKTKVFSVYTTISTYGSKQSNTLTLTYFYEPVLQCTLAEVGNNLQITNTSLNADNYNIRIERTDSQGDINVSIANNSIAGGSGASAYVVTPTKDTTYTVTLSTTVNGVTYYSTPQTLTIYLPQSPTFNVENNTLPYTIVNTIGFQFNNTTADTLGHTANFAGNKWRWEWGDTTYTDVNVGAGADGDRNIPIFHTYTLTLAQINAGIPVIKTVTLKAYNGETGSPFSSASQTVTILPLNPNFPNRSYTTLDDANIPDIIKVKTTQVWGVTGGGNT